MAQKIKVSCHVCACTNKVEVAPEFCPSCKTNLVAPVESLRLRAENTTFGNAEKFKVGAIGAQQGDLLLTSHRLIGLKEKVGAASVAGAVGGLVGGLLEAALAGKYEFEFEIPLTNVVAVEEDKIGLFKALVVRTVDGQAYKMKVPKREKDQWAQLLLRR
ncbi:MAG: hypothetical protein FWB76_07185 [Oscillospiraceae bacterium]|nr:hypothetical protein [Oscillospiraceae bacterium]